MKKKKDGSVDGLTQLLDGFQLSLCLHPSK